MTDVVVLGVTYDLASEVHLPQGGDVEALLYDNAERVTKWGRLVARCQASVDKARDELETAKAEFFVGVWDELERRERAELKEFLGGDEDDAAEAAADKAAGDRTFEFRSRAARARKVTGGPAACRWRRNFSDDLVHAQVNREPAIVTLKKALRVTKNQLAIAECVLNAVEHRSRCISHLCAIHRDNTRH